MSTTKAGGGIIGGALSVGATTLFPGQWALFYFLMGFAGWFLGYFAGAMVQEYRESRESCPPGKLKLPERTPNFCARNGGRLTIREHPSGFDEKDGHEKYDRWLACIDWHGTSKYKLMDPGAYGYRIARSVTCEGTFREPRSRFDMTFVTPDYLDCAPEYVEPKPIRKAAAK